MAKNTDQDIKLYHYGSSPYARKIVWYLTLRGLTYVEVKQPVIMPRPDLQEIGVNYRRIPVMAIGKDVYCDTRIILRKLEELFPEGKLGATSPDQQALQKLLEIWHVEGPVFWRGVNSMPSKMFSDSAFRKDREQMTGRPWDPAVLEKQRPESLIYIQSVFRFYEKLFSDGRDWILSTQQPSLADIEAIFVVHWLRSVKVALPKDLISQTIFPKTFAWMARFDKALETARSHGQKARGLDGPAAAKEIFAAEFAEREGEVDPADPQRLQKGDQVELFPTDSGSKNKDHGTLLSLTDEEITIKLDNGLRLHTPRSGFRVSRLGSKM